MQRKWPVLEVAEASSSFQRGFDLGPHIPNTIKIPKNPQKSLNTGYWEGKHINRRYLRNDKASGFDNAWAQISLTKIHYLLINPADNAYQEIDGKSFSHN